MLEHFWRVLFCLLRRFVFSTVGVSAKAQRFSTRRRFGLLLTISSCSPLQPPQLRPRKLHLQPPEQRHDVLGAWHAAQHHLLRPGATRLGHLGRIAQVGQPSRQRRVAVGPGQPQRLMGVGPQEGPAQPTAGGQTLADVECRPGRISRRMLDQKADSAQTDVCCSRPCSRIANEQADNQNGHRRRLLRERPVAGACSGSRSSGAWMSWRGQAWSRSRREGDGCRSCRPQRLIGDLCRYRPHLPSLPRVHPSMPRRGASKGVHNPPLPRPDPFAPQDGASMGCRDPPLPRRASS